MNGQQVMIAATNHKATGVRIKGLRKGQVIDMDNIYKDYSQDEINEEMEWQAEQCGMTLDEYENLDPESWEYIQSHSNFN